MAPLTRLRAIPERIDGVTPTQRIRLRSCRRIRRPYNNLNEIVGTTKRSIEAIPPVWLRRNVLQPCAPRIHGELLKLGIDIGQTSVAKYMARRRRLRRVSDRAAYSGRHHDRGAGNRDPLASGRLSLLLGLEIASACRQAQRPARNSATDPGDEPGQSALGRSPHPWRAPQARHRRRPDLSCVGGHRSAGSSATSIV